MSDLDEEELKATREMKAINKIIAPEEKTADEMFEELGYIKVQDDDYIVYRKDLTPRYYKVIEVYKDDKEIITKLFFRNEKMVVITYDKITLQELQAINKKCKELGWLE